MLALLTKRGSGKRPPGCREAHRIGLAWHEAPDKRPLPPPSPPPLFPPSLPAAIGQNLLATFRHFV